MNSSWVGYAFISFTGYFLVSFLFKFVSTDNPLVVSFILNAFSTLALFLILLPGKSFSLPPQSFLVAAAIGLASIIGTVFALKAIRLAPNPGYAIAIYSSNFVLVTLISVFVFHAPITPIKLGGVLAIFVGLAMLSL